MDSQSKLLMLVAHLQDYLLIWQHGHHCILMRPRDNTYIYVICNIIFDIKHEDQVIGVAQCYNLFTYMEILALAITILLEREREREIERWQQLVVISVFQHTDNHILVSIMSQSKQQLRHKSLLCVHALYLRCQALTAPKLELGGNHLRYLVLLLWLVSIPPHKCCALIKLLWARGTQFQFLKMF